MFERMLARKYITAQKRHSALTICSIAIALALITMLFSMFSTVISNLRSIAYSQGDYHIEIAGVDRRSHNIDKELHDIIIEAFSEFGTCTSEELVIDGRACYFIKIMLDKSIDRTSTFMDRIAEEIGVKNFDYLTNDWLILFDIKDAMSGLYMAAIILLFYIFVLFLTVMLRLIIDTAFEISSKERERQFGVLQSIGATPKQIVRIITYEGLMLSVIGIPLGAAAGIGLGYLVYRAVLGTGLADLFLTQSKAAELVHFSVNPWLLLLSIVTGAAWVLFSAYGTGLRIIKMSPVQAISQRANTVKKVSRASLFGKLFGWTGKIASRNNMRQPKRFIAVVVSLTLSIALFSSVTVVVNDLRSAAEDYDAKQDVRSDFTVRLFDSEDDPPLSYRKDLNALKECGMFNDMFFSLSVTGTGYYTPESADTDDIERISLVVTYCDRNAYNNLFGSNPPVSYDELAESGGYIAHERLATYFGSKKSISLTFSEYTWVTYSEEEYNALPPEEQKKCTAYEYEQIIYGYYPTVTVDFNLYYTADYNMVGIMDYDTERGGLIATLDQYENGVYSLFTDVWVNYNAIHCDLIDTDDYYKAIDFFEQNSIYYEDSTAENRLLRALLASVNIVAAFLSIMIALIAIVNMVNIIATGILNRRSELAALQCVGMTEKELRKMTVIECLQYALTSGIAAVAVCELIMFLTEKMLYIVLHLMESLGDFISYVQPLPIIGVASLCTFIIAIAASIIPLRAMRRTSLVEQIRSVE